ncbi:MAG: HAD family hydrolase [Halobacteriales archaeon]
MTDEITALLFDLDGTLCEYERSPEETLPLAFEEAGVEPFFGIEAYYDRFEEFVDGSDEVRDLRERCFRAIARDRDRDPELGSRVADAYSTLRDPGRVSPLPGAENVVETLAAEYRLGVVTNGPPDYQQPKLDTLEFTDAFETVVFAGFDTAAKPEVEPFERALADLDADASGAVHVGNSLDSDVAGAQAAGLDAAWLDDGSDPELVPEYVLESLSDLLERPWT